MSYLKNREDAWIKEQMKLDRNREKEIVKQLQNAIDAIQNEIEANWDRFSNGQKITISEARKMANKMDVKRFERKAKEYVKNKDFSPQANKELKIYNLVMRVSRLELLKSQIGLELITLFDELDKWGYSQLTEAAKEEYLRQAGIDGLTNGINANANSALAAARGVADQIVSTMKSAMDIHSPSRVMRDEVGKMIPAGVAVGIDKYSNFVEKSMQRLSKKVAMPALDNLNSNLSFSGGSQSLAFAGDVSSKFTVEVPVIFDSSEVARVIAKPMSKELQNQQDKKNVSLGRRR